MIKPKVFTYFSNMQKYLKIEIATCEPINLYFSKNFGNIIAADYFS